MWTQIISPWFKLDLVGFKMQIWIWLWQLKLSLETYLLFNVLFPAVGNGRSLTKIDEERCHRLVRSHVNQPSAQTEMWENQQHLLHYVVDVFDILLKENLTNPSEEWQTF